MLSTPTSHVFVHRDPNAFPPPGPSSTRFVCISDTHSHTFVVPPGDVLLHSGDLSSWGKVSELKKTINWLASLPHPVKIIIAGNHDLCLDRAWQTMFNPKDTEAAQVLVRGASARDAGIHYLEYESFEFMTPQGRHWKVYGSPAAPKYAIGAFQYEPGVEARELYRRIPLDTDILLTHTPPYQTHDLTRKGKHAGCKDLAERLQQLKLRRTKSDHILGPSSPNGSAIDSPEPGDAPTWNCRLHVWGHIHEAHGASIETGPSGERVMVNAALASGGEPIIVDLDN